MKEKGEGQGILRVAGAMSGTSMDGVDLAVIETDGVRVTGFGPSHFRPYSEGERAAIRAALGCWPGEAGVAEAAEVVETAHVEAWRAFAADAGEIAFLGFHGQTLAHDPAGGRTHQAGDGRRLADALGLPVVWDFRSADVGLGGEGAPLAPFYHWGLARHLGAEAPVAFLNLGGVGNLTLVDPRAAAPETDGALVAFDTGPANAPLDDLMAERGLGALDEGGRLAATGRADGAGVAEFLRDPWFAKAPPKSLDRGAFDYLVEAVSGLSDADAMATLVECVAGSVQAGVSLLPDRPARVLVTGGGRKNGAVMAALTRRLGCPVEPVEAAGFDGDFLEAQAFAYLAVRVARGMVTSAPGTTGVGAPVGGGVVSRPE